MRKVKPKCPYPSIYNAPYGKHISAYLINLVFFFIIGFLAFISIDGIYSHTAAEKKPMKIYLLCAKIPDYSF